MISHERARCARCRRLPRVCARGRAVGEYGGSLRHVIHALKYGGHRSIAPRLAALMQDRGIDLLDGADAVVPVPLHPSRRRSRGFNQAADLAAHLGLPVWDVLRRTRRTVSQTDLPAARRHRNVRGAFALARGWSARFLMAPQRSCVKDKCLVIVDDVSTTGATLEACARVLKAGGAREIRALTAARVVGRRP